MTKEPPPTLLQQLNSVHFERLKNLVVNLRSKMGRVAVVSVLMTGGLVGEAVYTASANAETVTYSDLGYPWKDAPCEFGSNGGDSCTNPAVGMSWDKYDWGVYDSKKVFHQYRNGYEYRNCTDYVQWKEATLGVSVPSNLNNGGQWYDNVPASEQSTTPKAWDAAVVPGNPGHVAFVESVNSVDPTNPVNDNITVSEYNHDTKGNGDTRTGTAASMGFTEFIDFGIHPAGTDSSSTGSTATSYSDGTFLKVNENGAIYRMVGNAPIRIYNQGAIPDFDGGKVKSISASDLGKMANYPVDGEFISIAEAGGSGVYEFVGGAPIREYNWGILPNFHGAVSINFQSLATLDHMLARPKDGSVVNIQEAGGSGIYEFVGGAPIRQYNWGAIPNFGNAVNINYQSLATLDHMNAVPTDGSAISIAEAGGAGIYRFVGGAPVRLYNQGAIKDMPNVVWVNFQSLATLDHMNARPTDGSVISIAEAGGSGIYEFAGGTPIRLFNQGIIPGLHNAVTVNSQSLATLDHMNSVPTDGEFISSVESGVVYRAAGGAVLRLYNPTGIPGYNGSVKVNQQSIDSRDHLNATPADGTVIEGVSSQSYWKIVGGKRVSIAPQSRAVVVDEQTVANIPT